MDPASVLRALMGGGFQGQQGQASPSMGGSSQMPTVTGPSNQMGGSGPGYNGVPIPGMGGGSFGGGNGGTWGSGAWTPAQTAQANQNAASDPYFGPNVGRSPTQPFGGGQMPQQNIGALLQQPMMAQPLRGQMPPNIAALLGQPSPGQMPPQAMGQPQMGAQFPMAQLLQGQMPPNIAALLGRGNGGGGQSMYGTGQGMNEQTGMMGARPPMQMPPQMPMQQRPGMQTPQQNPLTGVSSLASLLGGRRMY